MGSDIGEITMILTYEDLQNLKEKAPVTILSEGVYHAYIMDGSKTTHTISAKCIKRFFRKNLYEAKWSIRGGFEIKIDTPYDVYKTLKDLHQIREEKMKRLKDKYKAEKVDSFMKYLGE